MTNSIPTNEEIFDAELEKAWNDAEGILDEECTCWCDNDCSYHPQDEIIERHQIWRTL